MRVLFIGNFQNGERGELADETHIVKELGHFGNEVVRINRDEWREYVIEKYPQDKYKVPEGQKFDVAIICKWHHFYDGSFIQAIKECYGCPVVYWTWDYMDYDGGWHELMAKEADLFLTNEGGKIDWLLDKGIKAYYFPFDCADKEFKPTQADVDVLPVYDVGFFGSYLLQGERIPLLREINTVHPIHIWSVDWQKWEVEGFEAEPPVYGVAFTHQVRRCKIVVGINVNDTCWGYWSNRIGKTLLAGGCLLQRYVPGIELFVGNAARYFTTSQEAVEQIEELLSDETKRQKLQERALKTSERFTSRYRCGQLSILLHHYKRKV